MNKVEVEVADALATADDVAWYRKITPGVFVTQKGKYVTSGWKGCSDFIGMTRDGRFFAIEVKSGSGRAKAEQKLFIELVLANKGRAGVARSAAEAMAIIAEK